MFYVPATHEALFRGTRYGNRLVHPPVSREWP